MSQSPDTFSHSHEWATYMDMRRLVGGGNHQHVPNSKEDR